MELFKSLGFDFQLQPESTNGNLRTLFNGDYYFCNLEYCEEAGIGQLQYLVSERYLMEIKVGTLPLQSFVVLEARDDLLATLLQYVAE